MKFLKRRGGDKPGADDFNDYVEPFPPLRRSAPDPLEVDPDPRPASRAMTRAIHPTAREAEAFRDRLSELDFDPQVDLDDDDFDEIADFPAEDEATALARRVAEGTASAAPAHAAPGTTRTVLFPGEGSAPAADGVARRQPWPQTAPADPAPTRTLADAPEPFEDAPQQRIAMPPAQAQRLETPPAFEAPPPAAGRAGPGTGRARTRLLGFGQVEDPAVDPFARDAAPSPSAATMPGFPVGWLVVIDGPGRGAHFALFNGVSQIGRGADQTVALDFGDTSISRSGHALLAFDDEQGKFFLGSGGKVNIVRLNGQPLLSTEEMSDRDVIRIGETTLRFVAFCGPGFTWSTDRPDANGG